MDGRGVEGINVLSLFDGISCGRVALERAGVKVNNYFSSEIDKKAMLVSRNNYPDIIQLGDICDLDTSYWHNYIEGKQEVRFIRGRIKFERPEGPGDAAPFPSAVIVFRRAIDDD